MLRILSWIALIGAIIVGTWGLRWGWPFWLSLLVIVGGAAISFALAVIDRRSRRESIMDRCNRRLAPGMISLLAGMFLVLSGWTGVGTMEFRVDAVISLVERDTELPSPLAERPREFKSRVWDRVYGEASSPASLRDRLERARAAGTWGSVAMCVGGLLIGAGVIMFGTTWRQMNREGAWTEQKPAEGGYS